MGMGSITVFGISPADDEYKKKLAAYYACREAKVGIPEELQEFFDYDEPNNLGIETDLIKIGNCISELHEDSIDSCIINLSNLPAKTKFIKIMVSY